MIARKPAHSGTVRLPRSMAGMSLIELMVSITLGLIILTAVSLVFVNASSSRAEIERTSRQIENGRYAIDLLSDDLRLAGFYGELSIGSLCPTCTPPITNPPAALVDPCSTTAADWNSAIPLHLQGYDNNTSDVLAPPASCLPSSLSFQPGTDILVVRRVRTCLAGVAGCDAAVSGKPYIQVSLCATETTSHVLGLQGTATFNLTKKDCTTAADKRQYYVNVYYVSTDNGAGSTTPTLNRLEFTGAGWTTSRLVEGIEQFNVEYGIDTDGDGAPDVYVANPNDYPAGCSATCRATNWFNVVTVKLYVLARNLDSTPGYSDVKSYQLGSLAYTPASADQKYRRHVYTALVRVSNPANRRDTP